MWRDFNFKNHPISYETYKTVFEQQRITFGQPSEDECEICLQFEQHKKEFETENHTEQDCPTCTTAINHQQRAEQARNEHNKPIDGDIATFRSICKKLFCYQNLQQKEYIFVSRLVVLNETFSCRIRTKDYCPRIHFLHLCFKHNIFAFLEKF